MKTKTSNNEVISNIIIVVSLLIGFTIGISSNSYEIINNGVLGFTTLYLLMRSWSEFGKKYPDFQLRFPQDLKIIGLIVVSAIVVTMGAGQALDLVYWLIKKLFSS